MRLEAWMAETGTNLTQVARAIQVTPTTAWRYATGRAVPRKSQGRRLYVFTAGRVAPNDFYDLPELGSETAA